MATNELRMTNEEIDEDDSSPEILMEFYKDTKLQFATYVSSSKKNGSYDTVNVKTDADSDGDMDATDEKVLLDLAEAFSRFK